MLKKYSRMVFLFIVITTVVLFFVFDLNQYFSLEYIRDGQNDFANFYAGNRLVTIFAFSLIYILVTALSLPGAAIMTLCAGAPFI